MSSITTLYNWQFESHHGFLYLTGYLYCGKAWQTSDVWKLETLHDRYRVTTNYSVYDLYWS